MITVKLPDWIEALKEKDERNIDDLCYSRITREEYEEDCAIMWQSQGRDLIRKVEILIGELDMERNGCEDTRKEEDTRRVQS